MPKSKRGFDRSKSDEAEPDWSQLFPPEEVSSEANEQVDLEHVDDIKHAIALLAGVHDVDQDGLPRKRYLDGDQEFVARKAVARLLRSPVHLDGSIRNLLAALFDPETEEPPYSSFDMAPIERRIVFTGRHRGGGKIQNLRKLEIAVAFNTKRRRDASTTRDDAINEISEQFSVSTRTVEEALAYFNAVLREY